jgi:hypothetical protein
MIKDQMSILKVAKIFKRKLALASNKVVTDIQKVMGYASAVAANYDYADPAYDVAQNLAAKSYQLWNLVKNPKNTVTADQIKTQMDTLRRLSAEVAANTTDPVGQRKLNAFNSILNSVQPTDITQAVVPNPEKPVSLPPALQNVVKNQGPQPLPWDYQYPSAPSSPETSKAPKHNGSEANLGGGSSYSEEQENYTPSVSYSEDEEKVTQPPPGWQYKPHKW